MSIHFTKEEFSIRKSKVLSELKKQNLDALLMFKQESMYWLTGYDTFGYVFFQTLILTSKGDIVLLTRAPDFRQAKNTSIIKDIRISGNHRYKMKDYSRLDMGDSYKYSRFSRFITFTEWQKKNHEFYKLINPVIRIRNLVSGIKKENYFYPNLKSIGPLEKKKIKLPVL